MDKRAFLLICLLLIGVVIAQEMGPTSIPTVTIDVPPEAQAQAARIPTGIPADVVNAHAEPEFLELVCAMAQYHMQRFIDGSIAVKGHFETMVSDVKGVIPDLTLDTGVVDEVTNDMTTKLSNLCSATVSTYPTAIKDIIELAMGNAGAQVKLKDLGTELSSKIQVKADEYTAEGEALKAKASTALGGKTIEEVQAMASQITSLQSELQSLQSSTSGAPDMARIQQLGQQLQTLTGQMPSEAAKAEAETFKAEAQAFEADAQDFAAKVQAVFGNVEEKMQSAFAAKDYSSLKAVVNEKWYALFLKVFAANTIDIGKIKAEFAAYDIDTAPLDDIEVWIASKKEEAKSVFNADATEESITTWIAELQAQSEEKQRTVTRLIEQQVSDKWISDFEALKANADNSLSQARGAGLDTTEVDTIILQLEGIKGDAQTLIAEGNRSAALVNIKEAEALMPVLKAAYSDLQARGEAAKAKAEEAARQLDSQKSVIESLIITANDKGLDTSVIQSLTDELYAIESDAKSALGGGDNAEALRLLNEAKTVFEEVRVEFDALKGEVS